MFLLPQTSYEIRKTQHGRGVFATKDIEPGTIIGDYLGQVIPVEDEEKYEEGKDHFYLMYYDDDVSIAPDGNTPGIHLINHSCTPNTWMYTYHGHTLYFALRKIFKGEELTVSYQIGPVDEDCNPCEHLCTCGSTICKGTMHLSQEQYDKWLELEEKEEGATRRKEESSGDMLQQLAFYPHIIPDHPIYTLFGAVSKEPAINLATSLPSLDEIRQQLRDTGTIIIYSNLGIKVHGIYNELLVAEVVS